MAANQLSADSPLINLAVFPGLGNSAFVLYDRAKYLRRILRGDRSSLLKIVATGNRAQKPSAAPTMATPSIQFSCGIGARPSSKRWRQPSRYRFCQKYFLAVLKNRDQPKRCSQIVVIKNKNAGKIPDGRLQVGQDAWKP